MDSITQIILGAAVGEVVLGKKLGNKAMLWGGIAGTIPDLDVLTSPFISELSALTSHRGFTHSFLFTILGGIGIGWLVHKFYNKTTTRQDWQWLFFWGFLTHILLDCCTLYGTQVFSPFNDYRLAFSIVAVADFFYTIPFLFCLIMAARQAKASLKRLRWNILGITLSTFYLALTAINKMNINNTFSAQLEKQGITYDRCITGPTLLTNFLWNVTVDTGEDFVIGQYSIFDKSPISFHHVAKNYDLLPGADKDYTIQRLAWFSDGFYNAVTKKDGGLQINDLRFGTFGGTGSGENDFIFRFKMKKKPDYKYELLKADGGPVAGDEKKVFGDIWDRVKGK